jgi:hypothetical protein
VENTSDAAASAYHAAMITRAQIALAAGTVALAGGIAILVVLIVSNTDSSDQPGPPGLSHDLTAAAPRATPTPTPGATPLPASRVIFCVPATLLGEGRVVGLAPPGTTVRYRAGTCEPILEPEGLISVVDAEGTVRSVAFEPAPDASEIDRIVWIPAPAANSLVLTGRFILRARATEDEPGEMAVVIDFDEAGQELLRAITRGIVGMPLALFIGGEPVRTVDGAIWHSLVRDETSGPIVVHGLASETAITLAGQLGALLHDE